MLNYLAALAHIAHCALEHGRTVTGLLMDNCFTGYDQDDEKLAAKWLNVES